MPPVPDFTALRNRTNRSYSLIALIAILVGLTGVQLLVKGQFADSRALREDVSRIVVTRSHLSNLLATHLDAESGVRGFIITGDEDFLTPYNRGVSRETAIFAALRDDSSEAELERLSALQRLSDRKFANSARSVADVRRGQPDIARQRVARGSGKALMNGIKREIARLDGLELRRLSQLERQSESKRREAERFVTGILVGIALLLLVTTLLLARTIAQRQAALITAKRASDQERSMFDSAVDGVLLLDSHGGILRLNGSIERMFGYSNAELIGRHHKILLAEPFSDAQSKAWLARVGRAGVAGAGRREEFLGKRADGSTFETEVAISRFGDGDDSRFVATIRDITHRKRAERMKNEFVSTVSHELRTPLTSIGGSLALLAGGAVGELNERAARLVKIAHNNCERLIRLINDLLDIEKIESGKMTFDSRKVTLGSLIHRTVSANRQFAEDNGVKIEVELPHWPQCVMGDADRLEQVLTNLISNAIKFSPTGQGVLVTTTQTAGLVRVEVCDRGSGVPMAFRDRIFGRFAMADGSDSRVRGGTGLGLAIAREIVTRHGGTMGFRDRSGGGSVFFFELPLMADEIPVAPLEARDLPQILHIDDDLDCLSVVASAFEQRATLVSTSSIEEARAILAGNKQIKGCIVDVAVGRDSGLDFLPELKALGPNRPIILFTAFDDDYSRLSVDRVLVKSKTPVSSLVEQTMEMVSKAAGAPL